jgi:hypothetical protein
LVPGTDAILETDLRKSLADAPKDRDERLGQLADLQMQPHRPTRTQLRAALSSYAGISPWDRAREFAVIGFVIGLPWTVLDSAAVFSTLTAGGPFRLVDAAAGILVILRFGIAGLVIGEPIHWYAEPRDSPRGSACSSLWPGQRSASHCSPTRAQTTPYKEPCCS